VFVFFSVFFEGNFAVLVFVGFRLLLLFVIVVLILLYSAAEGFTNWKTF